MAHITLIRPSQVMPSDLLTASKGVTSIVVAYFLVFKPNSDSNI